MRNFPHEGTILHARSLETFKIEFRFQISKQFRNQTLDFESGFAIATRASQPLTPRPSPPPPLHRRRRFAVSRWWHPSSSCNWLYICLTWDIRLHSSARALPKPPIAAAVDLRSGSLVTGCRCRPILNLSCNCHGHMETRYLRLVHGCHRSLLHHVGTFYCFNFIWPDR